MFKKGIEFSFNWIFVIIVGSFFLIFFVLIITRQESITDDQILFTVKSEIKNLLSIAGTQVSSSSTLEIPETKFEFFCDDPYSSFISIDEKIRENLGLDSIFMPNMIRGEKFYLWSEDFLAPFVADRFLYFSGDNVDYNFIKFDGNDDIVELARNMKGDFNKRDIPLAILSNINFPNRDLHVVISKVAITEADIRNSRLDLDKVVWIRYIPDFVFKDTGILVYSTFSGGVIKDELSNYYDIPMLYGAIISGNRKNYDCTIAKTLRKYELTTKTLNKRLDRVLTNENGLCRFILDDYNIGNPENPIEWLLGPGNIIENILFELDSLNTHSLGTNYFKEPYNGHSFTEAIDNLKSDSSSVRISGDCNYVY